jgi:ankyrin repeat protein
LKDDSGNCPLHYACRIGDISIVRILLEAPAGRRALVLMNNVEQKPIDVCSTTYVRIRVEGKRRIKGFLLDLSFRIVYFFFLVFCRCDEEI